MGTQHAFLADVILLVPLAPHVALPMANVAADRSFKGDSATSASQAFMDFLIAKNASAIPRERSQVRVELIVVLPAM